MPKSSNKRAKLDVASDGSSSKEEDREHGHNPFLHSVSASQTSRRWNVLLERQKKASAILPEKREDDHSEDEEDPFDCTSMAIPSTHTMAARVLDDFAERWRQLDERTIVSQPLAGNEQAEEDEEVKEETEGQKKARRGPGHVRVRQLRLPDRFDYATRQSEPPADDTRGDRVVSLLDPTETHSHERELWKLFQQVPTYEELEEQALEGARVPNTTDLYNEMAEGIKYTDGHALSRLRMKDCHEFPPSVSSEQHDSTITIECWRHDIKKGPSPDANRAILEFQVSQTLEDVHNAIVELTRDKLWTQAKHSKGRQHSEEKNGYFFIEGTFYTAGSVDYITPIQEWLKTKHTKSPKQGLAAYLGIALDSMTLPVSKMRSIRLIDIPSRLGIRYHHVHHGDVECAMFVVDRRQGAPEQSIPQRKSTSVQYPIIHDVWGSPFRSTTCEACKKFTADQVTANTCPITQGHRALCKKCFQLLFEGQNTTEASDEAMKNNQSITISDTAAKNGENKTDADADTKSVMMVQPYAIWRSQPDLSTSTSGENGKTGWR